MIKAIVKVLLATKIWLSKAIGEMIVCHGRFGAIQVVARILSAMVKLLVIEVAGETVGKTGEQREAATYVLVLLEVACPSGVLSIMIGDSSNSQLRDFPPRASRMPNLLPRRPIDCLNQSL